MVQGKNHSFLAIVCIVLPVCLLTNQVPFVCWNFSSSVSSTTIVSPSLPDSNIPAVQQSNLLMTCSSQAPQSLTFPNGAGNVAPTVLLNGDVGDVISSSVGDMCRVCADSRRFLADNRYIFHPTHFLLICSIIIIHLILNFHVCSETILEAVPVTQLHP